jgi:hypothetical protein
MAWYALEESDENRVEASRTGWTVPVARRRADVGSLGRLKISGRIEHRPTRRARPSRPPGATPASFDPLALYDDVVGRFAHLIMTLDGCEPLGGLDPQTALFRQEPSEPP